MEWSVKEIVIRVWSRQQHHIYFTQTSNPLTIYRHTIPKRGSIDPTLFERGKIYNVKTVNIGNADTIVSPATNRSIWTEVTPLTKQARAYYWAHRETILQKQRKSGRTPEQHEAVLQKQRERAKKLTPQQRQQYNTASTRWHRKHPEYFKDYYRANKDRLNKCGREYRKAHLPQFAAYQRGKRAKDPEAARTYIREYMRRYVQTTNGRDRVNAAREKYEKKCTTGLVSRRAS